MPKVSLVIPVYNEAGHLKKFFEKIDGLKLPVEKELVIVDDFSKDGSRQIIESYPFQSTVKRVFQPKNMGKGAALKTGIREASGSIIGIQDADFEYDMKDLPSLIQPLLDDDADVVYGSRFRKNATQVHRTFHYMVNRFLTMMSNFFSGLYLSDMETCYKFFRAEIIQNVILESNRFGFEPEITAKISKLKVRVHELPIRYFPRNYMEGKKINWKDGVAAVFHILRFNLLRSPKDSFTAEIPEHYRVDGRQWL
ncbi:MAG: glycosyltransferase family 2 protein [Bdellovibrionales bacterium]|nr:glycosyltransferase family 2 protein [Bdellovibrionales bacterium]